MTAVEQDADWRDRYRALQSTLLDQYRAIPDGAPIRLAKRTSNLFRPRDAVSTPGLDVGAFDGVLHVDPVMRTADVLGMTTYEHLVDATLPYGLMPMCVPQLRTITLGGAVTGLGIESASFRNGTPHESVLEMDILTGDGEILTVTGAADDPHRDLFYGFPNSYGSLGYALRLRIELEPTKPFVLLRHVRFATADALAAAMTDIAQSREFEGRRVDFLDGTVFSPEEQYLSIGTMVDHLPASVPVSDYTGMGIYYRSLQSKPLDALTIHDYLWRWDTDWFWCSRAFLAQKPAVRRLWPKSRLRSDVYWKLVALERRYDLSNRVARRRGRPVREAVVQDIEVPVDRLGEFLEFFHREVGIEPIWVCPLRQRDPVGPVAAVRVRPRRAVRQRGLLVDGPAAGRRRARRGPREPTHRAGGHRPRRTQVPVLHGLLRPRDVPVDLRRSRVRQAQEPSTIRPADFGDCTRRSSSGSSPDRSEGRSRA